MKNSDIDKQKIAIVVFLAFSLVIILSIFVSLSLSGSKAESDSGLFKSADLIEQENRPVLQTELNRQEEYESREEMPAVTEESFYDTISSFLSSGNFDTLDNTLRYWQETYKDSTDESESKSAVIAKYRGDIAYYQNIIKSDSPTLSEWKFKTSDTLAASIAYSPIMKKYAAFISQDALIIPAVSEGINIDLRPSDKTNEEYAEIRNNINRTRRDETAFQQIAVYDMTLYGYPCQFVAVMDKNSMTWMPYSIEVTNNMIDLPTVAFGKDVIRSNPNANLDISIVIPAAISERPEGMEGNIDRSQDGIPDSQSIPEPIVETDVIGPAETELGELEDSSAETESDAPSASAADPETEPAAENESQPIAED